MVLRFATKPCSCQLLPSTSSCSRCARSALNKGLNDWLRGMEGEAGDPLGAMSLWKRGLMLETDRSGGRDFWRFCDKAESHSQPVPDESDMSPAPRSCVSAGSLCELTLWRHHAAGDWSFTALNSVLHCSVDALACTQDLVWVKQSDVLHQILKSNLKACICAPQKNSRLAYSQTVGIICRHGECGMQYAHIKAEQ